MKLAELRERIKRPTFVHKLLGDDGKETGVEVTFERLGMLEYQAMTKMLADAMDTPDSGGATSALVSDALIMSAFIEGRIDCAKSAIVAVTGFDGTIDELFSVSEIAKKLVDAFFEAQVAGNPTTGS